METGSKKHAASLGIRIGTVFVLAAAIIMMVAYYVLSQNFYRLLTEYTIQLVQSMTGQGVKMVESELEIGKNEASLLAAAFHVPEPDSDTVDFPEPLIGQKPLRMIYATRSGSVSSDGRTRDIQNRPDVQEALRGETAVYGPYYNEENEFVICYTSPIQQNGVILGALSVEKDGYRFCELIENIRFADSGESYIINAEGTDIAVSRREHIEWVTEQYNAQRLYEANPNEETRSIMELEQKGLRGETGVGTYYWEGSQSYVVYAPIPSENWVFLAGLREKEIISMTKSTIFASLSNGPVLGICLIVLLALTVLIIFWIISSMKKTSEINQKLELIANHDSLTGLLNRRFLETSLSLLWKYPVKVPCQAAVFMLDIDNFKRYNDFFGHPQGDDCLCRVAGVFKNVVDRYDGSVIRYGGEEFVAATFQLDQQAALALGEEICRLVEREQIDNGQNGVVTVSVGVCHVASTLDASLYDCIQMADKALYQAKREGKNRAIVFDMSSNPDS